MKTLAALLLLVVAVPAAAQQLPWQSKCPADRTLVDGLGAPIAPAGKLDFGVEFRSKTVTSATLVCPKVLFPPNRTDASSAAMIVSGPTCSGSVCTFRIYPDQGCSPAGCRNGFVYQCDMLATAGNEILPISLCLPIGKMQFSF